MGENSKLAKTLKVNGVDYDVCAVESDIANKVVKSLEFKKYTCQEDTEGNLIYKTSNAPGSYNGAASRTIYYVPAKEGGAYQAPIYVPNFDRAKYGDLDSLVNQNIVLNYSDVSDLVSDLTGAMWYTCEKEISSGSLRVNPKTITDEDGKSNFARMGVVTGNNRLVVEFNNYNKSNKSSGLPLFLYISNDSGNLFLGGKSLNNILIPLAIKASSLVTSAIPGAAITEMSVAELFGILEGLREDIEKNNQNITENTNKNSEQDNRLDVLEDKDEIIESTIRDLITNQNNMEFKYYKCASPYLNQPNSITISGDSPNNTIGNDGDIWIKYE